MPRPRERVAERVEHDLLGAAADTPDRVALDDRGEVTYGDLARRAAGIARALQGAGVRPGDRVAVWTGKSTEEVASLYGAWLAGAIAVPVHDVLKPSQAQHVLDHSGAVALLSTGRLARALDPTLTHGRTVLDPADVAPCSVREADLPGGDTPAALLYTSGSTGRPKGITISHENLLAGARIVSGYLGLRDDDRILSVLPFAFDYGLNQLLSATRRRATLVLSRSTLPATVCRHLAEDRVSVLAGVPPLWARLMGRGSPLPRMDVPTLRLITNSGGAFPTALLERYRRAFEHVDVCLMYGLTEAFRSTYLPPGELERRPTSMGKPIPETEILLVGEDGAEVKPGEIGELVHAGPTVALGYWEDPDATRARFRPHPLDPARVAVFSGDRVRSDEDGYFYFVGRKDQQMKCNGVRVSPDEVEEIVFASGLVEEVAVCGEPDATMGTRPVVHVVAAGDASEAQAALESYCRRTMPSYMWPRIVVRSELPRTASGKLDRKELAREGLAA